MTIHENTRSSCLFVSFRVILWIVLEIGLGEIKLDSGSGRTSVRLIRHANLCQS